MLAFENLKKFLNNIAKKDAANHFEEHRDKACPSHNRILSN